MSPKIALILLICSCVVLGLAYANPWPQQQAQQRYVQRNQVGNTQQQNKRLVNWNRRTVEGAAPTQAPTQPPIIEDSVGNGDDYGIEDETPSTQKPLATFNRDNKRPTHF